MATFTCWLPRCGVEFTRRKDCKVIWKTRYCIKPHWVEHRPVLQRENNRLRQQRYRERQKGKDGHKG